MSEKIDVGSYFDYDIVQAGWVQHEARLGYIEVLEETEETILRLDGNGAVLKFWRHKSGTPEHVRFTVNTSDEWAKLKRVLLETPIEDRVDLNAALAAMQKAKGEKRWFAWGGIECFEACHPVVGHEILCCAMVDDPEWAYDMFTTQTDLAIRAQEIWPRTGSFMMALGSTAILHITMVRSFRPRCIAICCCHATSVTLPGLRSAECL